MLDLVKPREPCAKTTHAARAGAATSARRAQARRHPRARHAACARASAARRPASAAAAAAARAAEAGATGEAGRSRGRRASRADEARKTGRTTAPSPRPRAPRGCRRARAPRAPASAGKPTVSRSCSISGETRGAGSDWSSSPHDPLDVRPALAADTMQAHSVGDPRAIASPESAESVQEERRASSRPNAKDAESARRGSAPPGSSSSWPVSSRRRSSESEKTYRRRVSDSTVVPMQAEMWLMAVGDFIELESLEPHQTICAPKDKLVRWEPSMRHVFFVSHQWTSFDHPDHTQHQLRTFQALLRRMMNGTCPATAPSLAGGPLQDADFITSDDWRKIVDGAHIWCASAATTPRVLVGALRGDPSRRRAQDGLLLGAAEGLYYTPRTRGTAAELSSPSARFGLHRALQSLLCAVPDHPAQGLADISCGFGSWGRRSWCRFEQMR